jgi:hypothetical protein
MGRYCRTGAMGVWLVAAMVLLAGAQLHNIFWPSVFGRVLITGLVVVANEPRAHRALLRETEWTSGCGTR